MDRRSDSLPGPAACIAALGDHYDADEAETLDRYGHLFPDDLDTVADALDAAADYCVRSAYG